MIADSLQQTEHSIMSGAWAFLKRFNGIQPSSPEEEWTAFNEAAIALSKAGEGTAAAPLAMGIAIAVYEYAALKAK